MKLVKRFIILFLLLVCCAGYADAQLKVLEPNVLLRGVVEEDAEAIGFFHFANHYWISYWSLTELPGNKLGKLYIYRNDGEKITYATTTTLIDMPQDTEEGGHQNYLGFTTDGEYVYAVNNSKNIFVIDPAQYAVVDIIATDPITGCVSIAYDYQNKGFWCSDMDGHEVYFVGKDGTVDKNRTMGTEGNHIMGLAYDDISEGGPYLWTSVSGLAYEQNLARIGRFHIGSGEYESFVYDAKACIGFYPVDGSYMGSIYIYPDYAIEKLVLAGFYSSAFGLFALDLGDISQPGTPRGVEGFSLSTSQADGLNVKMSWTNPTQTIDREAVGSLSSLKIYRNEELVHTINNPVAGASGAWTDTGVPAEGLCSYKIAASNDAGEGVKVKREIYAGEDVPGVPLNVVLKRAGSTSAKLTWSAPEESQSGGWFDTASLTYKVVRLPDNVVVAESTAATTFTDNTIVDMGLYSYSITALSRKGEGASATSEALLFGDSMTVPWTEYFDSAEQIANRWIIINNDGDDYTWTHNPYNGLTAGSMECTTFEFEGLPVECDDWFISPAIKLEKDKEYRLRYFLGIETETSKALEVRLGTSPGIETQTTLLKEYNANIERYAMQDIIFTVPASDEYHISWHSIAEGSSQIDLADVSIEELSSIDMALLSYNMESEMVVDIEYTIAVKVKNEGKTPAKDFKINLKYAVNNGGSVHVAGSPYAYGETLATGEEAIITFKFTPVVAEEHVFVPSVEIEGDNNESNNTAMPYSVLVYPKGTEKVFVGDPNFNLSSQLSPFNFYYLNGTAQTLYYKGQLGKAGIINQIEYYYSFNPGTPVEDKEVKIYMAHTAWDDMYEGWIKADTVLVFDGELDFVIPGRQTITIDLDKPFIYNGKDNLMVFTLNSNDKSTNPMNQFYVAKTNAYTQRVNANNVETFNFDQVGRINNEIPNTTFVLNRMGGSLSGIVKDRAGKGLEGVTIGIEGEAWTALTDESGNYEFPFFPTLDEPCTLTASLPGYVLTQTLTISVNDKEDKVLNISMDAMETANKQGMVIATGGQPVEEANVILSGNAVQYQELTGASGSYAFEGIYCMPYSFHVYKEGYQTYAGEVSVKNDAAPFADVELEACESNPPVNFKLTANSDNPYNIVFEWGQPDGITLHSYVTAYNVYIDGMLVETRTSKDRRASYEVPANGEYTCALSAIWNSGCESERVSKAFNIEVDLWETTVVGEFPWVEGFETGAKESYWRENYLNAARTPWLVLSSLSADDKVLYPHSGDYFISLKSWASATNISRLITPCLDLSEAETPKLKLWRYQAVGSLPGDIDELSIKYKNAPEADWVELVYYPQKTNGWVEATISLPNPTDTYWIAFDGITFFGYGLLLDDISVYDDEACNEVNNLSYTQLNGTQDIKLEWDAPSGKGVASYTVKRGDTVIADKITARTFTDVSVAKGDYDYYVIANYNKTTCTESAPAHIFVTVNPLSIDKVALETLAVVPNPATTTVKFKGEDIVSVSVYNTLGGLIDTVATNPKVSEQTMNVSQYGAGTYLFKFATSNGETAIRKIVVRP